MTEFEGEVLAAIPKWREPESQWRRANHNTLVNIFGVVDDSGKTIRGVEVEFSVFFSPRGHFKKYVFTLRRTEFGITQRGYQQEINFRPGLKKTDHAYSHEHIGDSRVVADASWATAEFEDAVTRFCKKTNLNLTPSLPRYDDFELSRK